MADYLVPMAAEMPDIDVAHVQTLSSVSELGAKGVGESGTGAAPAVVMNAINDALHAVRRPRDDAADDAGGDPDRARQDLSRQPASIAQRASGPLALRQASMPPWMWQAEAMPASCAACTAIAERSPKAQ